MPEVTALGAAKAAGLALGIRMDQQLAKLTTFKPAINTEGVYMCVCVCVCTSEMFSESLQNETNSTHVGKRLSKGR